MTRRTRAADNSRDDQHRQRMLFNALPDTSSLKDKLNRCGTLSFGSTGWAWRCRQPSCADCRARYARAQAKQAKEMMAGADHAGGGFLTVVLCTASTFEEVEEALVKARRDLRRFIDRKRKKDPRWRSFALRAWFEFDALDHDLLAVTGDHRRTLIEALGVPHGDGTIWSPTIHGLARFDGLTVAEVEEAFQTMWSVDHQVRIEPFRRHLTMEQNTQNIVHYSVKNSCVNKIDGKEHAWPVKRMADLYEWQSSWSQSFKRLRISIMPSKCSSEHDSYSNITGATPPMPLHDLFRNLPIVVELQRRSDFEPKGGHLLAVDMESTPSRLRYRDARQWCSDQCGARWRCAVTRSRRSPTGHSPALFEFEHAEDQQAFALAEASGWRR